MGDSVQLTEIDPRSTGIDILRKLDKDNELMPHWDGDERSDGTKQLSSKFIDHAKVLYKVYAIGGSEYQTEPKNEHSHTLGESEDGIRDYAGWIIRKRVRESNLESVKILAELITAPEGWEKVVIHGAYIDDFSGDASAIAEAENDTGNIGVILRSDRIRLIFNLSPVERLDPYGDDGDEVEFNGHTNFLAEKEGKSTWYTKSRRGVDDSFYGGDLTDIDELIDDQIEYVIEARERISGLVTVPGTTWSINPSKKELIAAKMRKGGHHFMPAGFGIGHMYSTRRESYSTRAAKETEKFFGVSPLYYRNTDCD